MFDLTDDESFDWMGRNRDQRGSAPDVNGRNELFGTSDLRAAAEYTEGQKVNLSDGTKALIVEVWTSGEREGPDGETYEPTEDSPVYIVATVDGAEAVTADDLSGKGWDTDADSPDDDLADAVAEGAHAPLSASIEATLSALPDDFDPETDGTLTAGPTDWDYPDSWDESDTPNRLILLDAWSSMGGQFDCGGGCCKGTMMSNGMSDGASDRFCASMKDRVLMWEGWRR